jgi:streptothricin acetyltransferase
MKITIEGLNPKNLHDVNRCDGEFTIEARLVVHVDKNRIGYTIEPVEPRKKRYDVEEIDTASYMANPDRAVFLAYADGQIAGQIILYKNWNQYAFIEDIGVNTKFRQRGIGSQLMAQGRTWAESRGLVGIVAETQDSNVGACMFYKSCGFVLGGLDTCLYQAFPKDKDEIALFWYLVFPPDS